MIKLRNKPKRPERRKDWARQELMGDVTLAQAIALVEHLAPLDQVVITSDHDGAGLSYLVDEPEEAYLRRLESYKVRLATWTRWYEENQEEIERTKAQRHEERKRRAQEKVTNAKKYFQRQLEQLNRREKALEEKS